MDPLTIGILLIVVVIVVIVIVSARRRSRAVPPADAPTNINTLAILGFVLAFIAAVPGVVLAHIALGQIKRTHERGWGLAVAALIIGYFAIVASLATAVVLIVQASISR